MVPTIAMYLTIQVEISYLFTHSEMIKEFYFEQLNLT